MARPTVAEIDIVALANNWSVLTQIQKAEDIIPVIKANAYGHGVVAFAQTLQNWGVQRVAVALFEEAEELRRSGFQGEILVLGPFATSDIPAAQELALTPMVGDREFLLALAEAKFAKAIHIKWDTGMHRLGLAEEETGWLRKVLEQYPHLKVQAFCTHFLKGDDFGLPDGYSEAQLQCFQRIEAQFPEVSEKHIFNSDSFFANQERARLPFSQGSFSYGARTGLSLYGYCGLKTSKSSLLQPVMTLKTKVVHLVRVNKGAGVSYNATWTAKRDSLIAVLPIGYADGYPRSLSNKGQVFIRGEVVPLVGTVCMDYLMIDVTDIPSVQIGDEVELWGKKIPLETLAKAAGTITYELVTALTSRVPRKVLY